MRTACFVQFEVQGNRSDFFCSYLFHLLSEGDSWQNWKIDWGWLWVFFVEFFQFLVISVLLNRSSVHFIFKELECLSNTL